MRNIQMCDGAAWVQVLLSISHNSSAYCFSLTCRAHPVALAPYRAVWRLAGPLAGSQQHSPRRGADGRVSALYLLARMTMSIPQNILIIQPTITIAVRIWISAAAMFSQKTQHMCLSGRSVRAPHSTVKADTSVPVERAARKHTVKATASCYTSSFKPTFYKEHPAPCAPAAVLEIYNYH